MKYYTPDLLERFASADEQVVLAAQDELEERAAKYAEQLSAIAKKLPARFRELQERFYLHDARVVWPFFPWLSPDFPPFHPAMLWEMIEEMRGSPGRWPTFMMAVQLDAPPKNLLVLDYRHVRVDARRLRPWRGLEWRHDEIELVPDGDRVEFQQSILFNEGLELRLQFTDFDFAMLKPIAASSQPPGPCAKVAS